MHGWGWIGIGLGLGRVARSNFQGPAGDMLCMMMYAKTRLCRQRPPGDGIAELMLKA